MGTAAGVDKTRFIFTTMGSCGPKTSGGEEVVPSLVPSGTQSLRVEMRGGVYVSGFLALAGGAAVVRPNTPAMGGAECTRDPLVLDGGAKLGDGLHVIGGSRDCSGALQRTWIGGLIGEEELNLEELVSRELGEFSIGGDKGFEDSLFIGDHSRHVVEVTVELRGHKKAL